MLMVSDSASSEMIYKEVYSPNFIKYKWTKRKQNTKGLAK